MTPQIAAAVRIYFGLAKAHAQPNEPLRECDKRPANLSAANARPDQAPNTCACQNAETQP